MRYHGAWQQNCQPKSEECFGIKRAQDINAAKMAKLRQKLVTEADNI